MTAKTDQAQQSIAAGRYRDGLALVEEALRTASPEESARLRWERARLLARLVAPGAEAALRGAARELRRALGARHALLADCQDELARYLLAQGRPGEAAPLAEAAHALRLELFSPEHPATAESILTLAELHDAHGRLDVARSFYEEAAHLAERIEGERGPVSLDARNRLAYLVLRREGPGAAEPLLRAVLARAERALAPTHPRLGSIRWNLALALQGTGREAEAAGLLEAALVLFRDALGTEHPKYEGAARDLANLYEVMGRDGEARALRARYAGDAQETRVRTRAAAAFQAALARRAAPWNKLAPISATLGGRLRCAARFAGAARSVAFSLDGSRLAVVSPDGLSLYRCEDLSSLVQIETRQVYDAHFGPGGDLLARDGDGAANLWLPSGAFLRHVDATLPGTFARLPYGPHCVLQDEEGLALFDLASGATVRRFSPAPAGELLPLALSAAGEHLAVAAFNEPHIHLFDIEDGTLQRVIECPQGLRWITFAQDGSLFAALSDEVWWWRAKTFAPGGSCRVKSIHKAPLRRVAVSPDGSLIATASAEPGIGLFARQGGSPIALLEGHAAPCEQLLFHPGGAFLASVDDAQRLRLWTVHEPVESAPAPLHEGVPLAAFFPEGEQALLAGPDARLRVVESYGGASAALALPLQEPPSCLALSQDGQQAAVAGAKSAQLLWLDREEAASLTSLAAPRALCFSPDGAWLYGAFASGNVTRWATAPGAPRKGEELRRRPAHPLWLSLGADGWLLSLHAGGQLVAGRAEGAEALGTHTLPACQVAAAPPSGLWLATADGDHVRVFRLGAERGARELVSFSAPGPVGALAFSPDGATLAVAVGGSLRLYAAATGALIEAQAVHTRPIGALAFSPGGGALLSVDVKGGVASFSLGAKRARLW